MNISILLHSTRFRFVVAVFFLNLPILHRLGYQMTVQHIFSMSLRIIANLDILILQKDLIQSYAENIEF